MLNNTLYNHTAQIRKEFLNISNKIDALQNKVMTIKSSNSTNNNVLPIGTTIELRISDGYIQWSTGDTWNNLLSIAELQGSDGQDGTDGTNGTDGIDGIDGTDGINGQNIHHISFTSTTALSGLPNQSGEIDTYTAWGDVEETINLGDFTVKNGDDGTNGTNGIGIPIGGTTGQILTKKSNDDYDTEWATIISGAIALAGISFMSLGMIEINPLTNFGTIINMESN